MEVIEIFLCFQRSCRNKSVGQEGRKRPKSGQKKPDRSVWLWVIIVRTNHSSCLSLLRFYPLITSVPHQECCHSVSRERWLTAVLTSAFSSTLTLRREHLLLRFSVFQKSSTLVVWKYDINRFQQYGRHPAEMALTGYRTFRTINRT